MGYLIFKSVLIPSHLLKKMMIVSFIISFSWYCSVQDQVHQRVKIKFIKECRTKKCRIHSFSFTWKQRGGHGKQWWLRVCMSKVRNPVAVTLNYPIERKVYLFFYYQFVITDILSKSSIILMVLSTATLQKT